MTTALRAEVRKARYTRSLWALPVTACVIATIGAVLVATVGKAAEVPKTLSHLGPLRFGPTNFGLLLVVLGIRVFADETQHRTLSSTFVRTPNRRRVTLAKAGVAAGIALAFCLVVDAITIPVTAIALSARGLSMSYDASGTALMLGRVAVAMVLLAAAGVAVGATFRNRSVAMVAAILWFALAEDLLGGLLHVGRYLPGAAVAGLVSNADTSTHFAATASLLLLVAYGAVATVAAMGALRRDLP
jgi:ABC-type transport system involved in multi-copper enzyme maturation permease subunit